MQKKDNYSVSSKLNGETMGNVVFTFHDDIFDFFSLPYNYREQDFLHLLKEILTKNEDEIARLLNNELGKPISQCLDEIRKSIDYIDFYEKENVNQDKKGLILILGSIAEPIYQMTVGICENIYSYKKILYKPSTKATLSTHFIQQEIDTVVNAKGLLLITPMAKETLDEILQKIKVDKIINYSRVKIEPMGAKVEKKSEKDKILLVDSSCDMELATAIVQENVFTFAKFNSSRLQHVFVEKAMLDDYISKLITKFDLFLTTGKGDDPNVNFIDTYKDYKRKGIKEKLLELISFGADLVYGQIGDVFHSPLIFSCTEKYEEFYSQNLWAPVIFLIAYEDISKLPALLSLFNNHEIVSLLSNENKMNVEKGIGRFVTGI